MAARRLKAERKARWLLAGLLLLLAAAVGGARWAELRRVTTLRARMPEAGGWSLDTLEVAVGQPLRLKLVSDDVLHGFAIGQSGEPGVDLYPGVPVEMTLRFDQPGVYTFYCTRWCGPNHWRMRGVIVVTGEETAPAEAPQPPLFVTLGLDIDAPHPAPVQPQDGPPSPRRGAVWADAIPAEYLSRAYYETHSPAEAWQALRAEPSLAAADDDALWDAVAYLWQQAIPPQALEEGARLYAQNCAACHGAQGRGDGPFAASPSPHGLSDITAPPDFSDPAFALGGSPALWQGKILRGGMGTGMPSWGAIFTPEQTWALTDYLWTFSLLPAPAGQP